MTERAAIPGETGPRPARVATSGSDTLRRRIMYTSALAVLAVLGGLYWAGSWQIRRTALRQEGDKLRDIAYRSAALVEGALLERQREMDILARAPMVIDAARAATARSRELGLDLESGDALERRFAETRSLGVDQRLRAYLADVGARIGVAEVILTDRSGHNAVITKQSKDFFQGDERWWEAASQNGTVAPEAEYDDWEKAVVMTMAAAVREPGSPQTLGVIKLTYLLTLTDSALARAATTGGGIQVELVDGGGNVVASSTTTPRMKPLPGYTALGSATDSVSRYLSNGELSLAAAAPAGLHGWRVVAHVTETDAFRAANATRRSLLAGVALLALLMLAGLWRLDRFVTRRISNPAAALAAAAEAVAAGDLSIELGEVTRSNDEIGRLTRAIGLMITELRRLAMALRTSSTETAAMAAEITDGASAMAATAEAMATTSNDLSAESATMSQAMTQFANDSTRLVAISSELDAGSQEGLERNIQLRALATENRQRLDESSRALELLTADVAASASAADALATASEEIRAFVTFVQKMARQSKLLALNAAMEAARAGVHGQGFAVVANEVRRLAAGAAEAAERTETLVRDVLARVGESRTSTARTVVAVEGVLGTTRQGLDSFAQIEAAVTENEEWMRAISQASTETHALIAEMTSRLDSVSHSTESLAAAMEEVAASSEEQSASTAEIADVARALAHSAHELSRLVASFHLDTGTTRAIPAPPRGAPAVPVAAVREEELVGA